MDYTPEQCEQTAANWRNGLTSKPMSQGTCRHQLAMYVIYYSPLQCFGFFRHRLSGRQIMHVILPLNNNGLNEPNHWAGGDYKICEIKMVVKWWLFRNSRPTGMATEYDKTYFFDRKQNTKWNLC
jgi:hypothetical protein